MKRILLDIGHPGHVHYFRNAIRLLEQRGHKVAVVARDKEVTFNLLNAYGIPYTSRGTGSKGLPGKLLYILKGDYYVIRAAHEFKPDLFLSFASPYAAQAAWILGKPHISFDDTEHARLGQMMYRPFTDTVVTPKAYRKNFGEKQVCFDGFIELCHLAPTYFQPNPEVLKEVGLNAKERFILLRFVSWEASHDVGQQGLTFNQKIQLVNQLKSYGRIFISSEGKLPPELEPYRLKLAPHKIHHFLAYTSLYIGEGSTTASECALLGVPNILVNSLLSPNTRPGVHMELEQYGVQELFETFDGVLEKALRLLKDGVKAQWQLRRNKILDEKIDVTAFMVWLIENYPISINTMKSNPDFQYNFKLATEKV